jgi:hypothetical protein
MGSLDHWNDRFAEVGWFIPPYVGKGFLSHVNELLGNRGATNPEDLLEEILSCIYTREFLAGMVLERYPVVPHVSNFDVIISEAIEAHFLGLHHVAAAGLIPVIEGVGAQFATALGIATTGGKATLTKLADKLLQWLRARNIGEPAEIESMLNGFKKHVEEFLFQQSRGYLLPDKTNRHGIVHGHYADADFGRPLNFYKVMTAVNCLTFFATLTGSGISVFAPDDSPNSEKLAAFYSMLSGIRGVNPRLGGARHLG